MATLEELVAKLKLDISDFEANAKKAGQAAGDLGKATGDVGKEAEKGKSGLDKLKEGVVALNQGFQLAMAVATKVIATFKKALDFSAEGLQISRLEDASATLAKSMGADMDNIMRSLKDASKGMVADTDLMASAAKAMMLGVTSSGEDMAKLMEIAAVRARAMGISTQQAFDDIVRGIGRNSPLILDNLGIITDAESANDKYAKALGKTAEQLTEAEKTQALFNDVVEKSADYLEEAGGVLVDAAGQWEQMKAAQKNYFDWAKKESQGFAKWWAEMWTEGYQESLLIGQWKDAKKAAKELGIEFKDVGKGGFDFANYILDIEKATRALEILQLRVALGFDFPEKDFEYWNNLVNQFGADAVSAMYHYGAELPKIEEGQKDVADTAGEMAKRIAENAKALKDVFSLSGNFSGIVSYATQWDTLNGKIQENIDKQTQYQAIVESPLMPGGYVEGVYYTAEQAREAVEGLGDEFDDTDSAMKRLGEIASMDVGGYVDGVWVSLGKVKTALGETTTETEKLQAQMKKLSDQVVLDMMMATISIDGVTQGEAAAYFNMASELGLISDDAAKAAVMAYSNAITEVNKYEIDPKTGLIYGDAKAYWDELFGIDNWFVDPKTGMIVVILENEKQIEEDLNDLARDRYFVMHGSYDLPAEMRAAGGTVEAYRPYIVGEKGPELFVPREYGEIVPNSKLLNMQPKIDEDYTYNAQYGQNQMTQNIGADSELLNGILLELRLMPQFMKVAMREAVVMQGG